MKRDYILNLIKALENYIMKLKKRLVYVTLNPSLRNIDERDNYCTPQINQIEVHPYFNQQDVQDYCDKHDITVTA